MPTPAPRATPTARRATPQDLPALAQMLARAFQDDPVSTWTCPPNALRPAMLERFHRTRLHQLLPHAEIWSAPELTSAALWAPPEHWKTTLRQDLQLAKCMHPRLLARAPLIAKGMLGIERAHPRTEPHWYLAVLGTDPTHQGQGLGSATLAPVLERCDHDQIGAYLESSKQRNIHFYARHGFRVTQELRLPRGPRVWAMWRKPRP